MGRDQVQPSDAQGGAGKDKYNMDQFKHFLLTISNGPSSGNQLCSLIFTKHYQSLIVRFHTTTYSGASLRQRACRGAQLQGHPHL